MGENSRERQPLPDGKEYHFNVIYNHARSRMSETPDTKESKEFTKRLVQDVENLGYNRSYFYDRDALPGRNVFNELFRVINGSKWTVVVLSREFLSNCWAQYSQMSAFKSLLDVHSAHNLIPIGLKLPPNELPRNLCLQDVLFFSEHWRDGDEEQWDRLFKVFQIGLSVSETAPQQNAPTVDREGRVLTSQGYMVTHPASSNTSLSSLDTDQSDGPVSIPQTPVGQTSRRLPVTQVESSGGGDGRQTSQTSTIHQLESLDRDEDTVDAVAGRAGLVQDRLFPEMLLPQGTTNERHGDQSQHETAFVVRSRTAEARTVTVTARPDPVRVAPSIATVEQSPTISLPPVRNVTSLSQDNRETNVNANRVNAQLGQPAGGGSLQATQSNRSGQGSRGSGIVRSEGSRLDSGHLSGAGSGGTGDQVRTESSVPSVAAPGHTNPLSYNTQRDYKTYQLENVANASGSLSQDSDLTEDVISPTSAATQQAGPPRLQPRQSLDLNNQNRNARPESEAAIALDNLSPLEADSVLLDNSPAGTPDSTVPKQRRGSNRDSDYGSEGENGEQVPAQESPRSKSQAPTSDKHFLRGHLVDAGQVEETTTLKKAAGKGDEEDIAPTEKVRAEQPKIDGQVLEASRSSDNTVVWAFSSFFNTIVRAINRADEAYF